MSDEPIPLHPLRMVIDGLELHDLGKVDGLYTTTMKCVACGFEGKCQVDPELAALSGKPAAFRAAEDRAFLKLFIDGHRKSGCELA